MRAKRVSKAEQFQLILECRQSGLTDVQWCRENNIKPSTFYNWVSRMREGDYVIPESRAGECSSPNQQDVVRLDIFPDFQKTNETNPHPIGKPQDNSAAKTENVEATMEIFIGNASLRISNRADPILLSCLLKAMGGSF